MAVKKIKIEQIGSTIGRNEKQTRTLIGLGLTHRHKIVEVIDSPETQGMIRKVQHLIKIHN
jgi:large subunit ribosomal protein L30